MIKKIIWLPLACFKLSIDKGGHLFINNFQKIILTKICLSSNESITINIFNKVHLFNNNLKKEQAKLIFFYYNKHLSIEAFLLLK